MRKAIIRFAAAGIGVAMCLSLLVGCGALPALSPVSAATPNPPRIEYIGDPGAVVAEPDADGEQRESHDADGGQHNSDGGGAVRIERIRVAQNKHHEPFTFAWISDTQLYSESYPKTFAAMTEWVIDNRETEDIAYLFHTGDIVNDSRRDREWENAEEAIAPLFGSVAFGLLAGNHDVGTKTKNYDRFSAQFGAERFEELPYYGASYADNRGHYDLITAGGQDFLMLYMGWGVDAEAIAWMNEVLAAHADRIAILALHEYMHPNGTRTTIGKTIYAEVVEPNPNVYFVLCGHKHGAAQIMSDIDDDGDGKPDRVVAQMLANYQGEDEGGEGYLRLLTFDPENEEVRVRTFSPLTGQERTTDADRFAFPISY